MTDYSCPICGKFCTYRNNVRTHMMGTTGDGHGLSREDADLVIYEIERGNRCAAVSFVGSTAAEPTAVLPMDMAVEPSPVRDGHERSLALLEDTGAALATLDAFQRATGHPVYLRPTDKGLTVIGLDPALSAMVGVGAADDVYLDALPPSARTVDRMASGYRAKVSAMRRSSPEERFVLGRIARALGNRLQLDPRLLFLHQEWRFATAGKLDVLALDATTGQLVVIEAKQSERLARERGKDGRTAIDQAATYAEWLFRHLGALGPFFDRLATALHLIYVGPDCPVPRVDLGARPRFEVWWPGGRLGA